MLPHNFASTERAVHTGCPPRVALPSTSVARWARAHRICRASVARLRHRGLAVLTVIATACGGGGDAARPVAPPAPVVPVVAMIQVTPATATIAPAGSVALTAQPVTASGSAVAVTVTWRSSAPSIAIVDASGLVTGVTPGQATISATAGGMSGTSLVTVLVPVASVTLAGDTAALPPGATRQLAAIPRDAAGAPLTDRSVGWASSAPSVATVSGAGLVTAVAPGQTTIIASVGSVSSRITVTVIAPVASLTLSPDSLLIIPGEARFFAATLRDAVGTVINGRAVSWTSSASAVATVSATGTVTGVAAGRALVIALSEGRADTAAVRVVIPESRLVFDRIPSQVRPGLGLGLVVRATRTGGDTLRSFSGPVTIQDENGGTTLLGTATADAKNGLAVFDDLAIAAAGSYRLRATAPLLSSASSGNILVTAAVSLPTITVGQIERSNLASGVLGSSRYRIPVTLRDTAGATVGPTPVVVAINRGSAMILSGSTTATTASGTATFDLVIQGANAFDLSLSAPGFQTRVLAVSSPTDISSTFVRLDRAAADSVVMVGGLIPFAVSVQNSLQSAAAVHAVTYEVLWNPTQLSLSTETATTGASYTINRARTDEGVLRVTIAGTTAIAAIGQSALVQQLVFTVRTGASGTQNLRVTSVSLVGPAGEPLAARRTFDISFRVP